MRFALLIILLFLALVAYGQQTSVAVLHSEGTVLSNDELEVLTDKMRQAALKVLPMKDFVLVKQDVIVKRLGGEEKYIKECSERFCIVDLGKKAMVDYVALASVGKLGNKIRLKVELYNVSTEGLAGMLSDEESGNVKDLLAIVEKRVPTEVFGKIPGASVGSKAAPATPSVEGGISGLKKTTSYEADEEKLYVVSLSTDPQGAFMSFDGVPATSCPKTPCKAELAGGNVRIIAALEQYERADTTVLIKQNNQSISIKLKSNFGVLEIKPAYLDGIGKDKQWSLTINGKPASSLENNLSPNKYSVKLSHECYENISFDVGINKGKREVFDMAGNITLRKGGLTLSAERSGEPASEPVFVNGKQAGETPFSGSVPLCAKIEIGSGKEVVDVKLKYNEKVKYTHRFNSGTKSYSYTESSSPQPRSSGSSFTDSRDNKTYKMVKIGTQTWMAENLDYNASGSKCYSNSVSYCQKYGRLYDWKTAKTACPSGWHLPSKEEYGKLDNFVGGEKTAGKFLKATSGWNNNGNGTDKFGFSALPGGIGDSGGYFRNVGYGGYWWSAEFNSRYAHLRYLYYNGEDVIWGLSDKLSLYSVRCVQD